MKRNNLQHRKHIKYSLGDQIFIGIVYSLVLLITFICLYPMYFTVIASVSESKALSRGLVSFWPVGFQIDAYVQVFKNQEIWRGYGNTIFYTVFGTIFNLLLTIPTAYALSKKRMFGRDICFTLFLFTMYFGGGMIPTYILFDSFNMLNTRLILIVSGGLSVYNVIVTRTYFQSNIPESLLESARIDGASELRTFRQIVLPLSKPIIAVIALYYADGHWSSYYGALIYLTDSKLMPLQIVLRKILILNQTYMEEIVTSNATGEQLQAAQQRMELAVIM